MRRGLGSRLSRQRAREKTTRVGALSEEKTLGGKGGRDRPGGGEGLGPGGGGGDRARRRGTENRRGTGEGGTGPGGTKDPVTGSRRLLRILLLLLLLALYASSGPPQFEPVQPRAKSYDRPLRKFSEEEIL